jgi:hypothetical protein
MPFLNAPFAGEETLQSSGCYSDVVATLRNRELKIRSAAITAEPLGGRHAWEGRKTANGSCADLVQIFDRCLAPWLASDGR